MRIKLIISLIFLFISFLYVSCSNDTVDPVNGDGLVGAKIYQASKCLGNNLYKTTASDSSFTYDFSDDLNIDIIVVGNCCPDSNRFTSSYYMSSDTIYATVIDTAMNGCHCNCTYQMHFEFSSLEKDEYVFCCETPVIKYNEVVTR